MPDLKPALAKLADGNSLSRDETEEAFDTLMSGQATPSQIGGLLMAMRVRGETEDELAGAINAMRSKMITVDAPIDAIDIVGTGGDAKGSYNISTCTALVVAGCGVKVAKHGNRSLSSLSGAAEVLKCLGVNLELSPGQITDCIEEANIGFMFAPAHHPAMRHVGPTRMELGTRTIFNLLGPICNPAGVKRQLLGVFSPKWLIHISTVMRDLGSERLWVVHGQGFDEITITGSTYVSELADGEIKNFEVAPADFGLAEASDSDIAGGEPEYNATALRRVLDGEQSAYHDMVLMNAAASLMVADKVSNLLEGVEMARQSITSGNANTCLDKLVATSNQGLA